MVVDLLYIARYSTDLIRILIGLFHRPYETYRTLSQRQDLRFVPFVFVFILVYLLLAGVAKGGLRIHPLFHPAYANSQFRKKKLCRAQKIESPTQ
jgi:hypothetical protein